MVWGRDAPYNVYRFNAKRWDATTGKIDMGFRDYDPGLNRFLTRDMYNGALADMNLTMDPWNMNRYAFAGGNPISMVELDGHRYAVADGVDAPSSTGRVWWDYAWQDYIETQRTKQSEKLEQEGSAVNAIYDGLAKLLFEDYYTAFTGKDMFNKEEVSDERYNTAVFFSTPWGRIFKGGNKLLNALDEGFESLSRRWSNGGAKAKGVVSDVPSSLLVGPKNTHVYLGGYFKKPGKKTRTNDLRVITSEPLTRRQARAIEQALINRSPSFTNKINSISPKRSWYDEAVQWGEAWLKDRGY
ncbi:RHS repeat-associated protein [Melghirimyces profundicolus]|uniref:RHS repeat-associated protein n=1 Tax=Melghirimyces profundicolus TaxID=1242148 RepID=A0A2T6AU76_9BACL|nr:RHS repeat-associated core domain-containing protein [Melghirimyces profundicolus]PTX47372.1 RHS repeat-associated protein [Melghirimyces profundicolus]